MAIRASETASTAIITGDGVVKSSPGRMFWVAVYLTNPTVAVGLQLNDSTDNSGSDLFRDFIQSGSHVRFLRFDPPLEFGTGLYAKKGGTGTLSATIGYE